MKRKKNKNARKVGKGGTRVSRERTASSGSAQCCGKCSELSIEPAFKNIKFFMTLKCIFFILHFIVSDIRTIITTNT